MLPKSQKEWADLLKTEKEAKRQIEEEKKKLKDLLLS